MTTATRRDLMTVSLLALAAGPASAAVQWENPMNDRTSLTQLLGPLSTEAARMVADAKTTVSRVPTPFLRHGLIFRVDHKLPQRPVVFTVGYARQNNLVVLLANNPKGFQDLVAKAGALVDSHELRLAYALAALETTRRFDQTFAVLHDFSDLRPMANPDPAQQARLQQLRARYQSQITLPPPGGEAPWTMPVFVLQRNDLCLFTVTIAIDGSSSVTRNVLEADTPLLAVAR
jgi:hypothetical protein